MHYVFIVSNYYPNYSAVSKCVSNVAEILASDHKVTIICEKSNLNQMDEEYFKNQRILRIHTKDSIIRESFQIRIMNSKGCKSKILILLLNIYKVFQVVKLVFSKTSIKKELVNLYEKKLCSISEQVDMIIPCSMPYESVVAAINFRIKSNFKIAIVPYLFDHFVENRSLHRIQLNRILKIRAHKNLEMKIIQNSDKMMLLKQLEKFFLNNYSMYNHKFLTVEHPLLVKQLSFIPEVSREMNYLYAGSFYKNIRNPKYMLEIFNKILKVNNGSLNLFTFGNCQDIIRDYSFQNKFIKNLGSVDSSTIINEMRKQDFLVAVGNSDNTQIPSKIFEYMSIGLPIIYFYSIDNDENIKVLSRYSLSICLKQSMDCFEENCSKLIEFSLKNVNKRVDFNDVSRLFPESTPEFTVQIIKSIL